MKNMKIAFLISSLSSQAPVFVLKDIIDGLMCKSNIDVQLFYLDDIVEVDFSVPSRKLNLFEIRSVLSQFDIVHSHGIRPDILTNLLPSSVKTISTQHNIIYEQYEVIYNKVIAKIIEFIWLLSLKRKSCIVAIGKASEAYYKKKLPQNNIVNINNGRSPQKKTISSEDQNFLNNLSSQYIVIGACTRAVKLKGHDQIIKALVDLPKYAFVLVGDGDYLDSLKKLSCDLGVENRCYFLGYRKNTYGYMDFFNIYGLTSHSESISIALLEAASAHKSIVCSDIPSNRSLFTTEEVCFFSLDDIDSLKKAIIQCQKIKFSQNIYKKYMSEFTKEIMVDKYYQLYLSQSKVQNL